MAVENTDGVGVDGYVGVNDNVIGLAIGTYIVAPHNGEVAVGGQTIANIAIGIRALAYL